MPSLPKQNDHIAVQEYFLHVFRILILFEEKLDVLNFTPMKSSRLW